MKVRTLGAWVAFGLIFCTFEPALAATGDMLANIDPGGPQGDGRGVAFDGQNLYYTISVDGRIYEMSPVGGPGSAVRTISVPSGDPRGNTGNGPLAWDGGSLWVAESVLGQKLFEVDPVTGATLFTCDLAAANPGHPALSGLSAPAGLDMSRGLLVLAGDIGRPGSATPSTTVFVNPTDCHIVDWHYSPVGIGAPGYGSAGLSTDRNFLWQSAPTASGIRSDFFQTDLTGAKASGRPEFTSPSQTRDLAFDSVTFPGSCALWATEGSFYIPGGPPPKVKKQHLLAFEVPCNEPPACDAGGPYVAECSAGAASVNLNGSGSSDAEGLPLGINWSTGCPGSIAGIDQTSPTLGMSGFTVPVNCSANLDLVDFAGDAAACTAAVQVVDSIPPALNVPKHKIIGCLDPSGVPVTDPQVQTWLSLVTASDSCAGVTVNNDLPPVVPITCAKKSGTPVNFTAVDDAGNITTGSSLLQVVDWEEPVIQGVPQLTLHCPFDSAGGAMSDSRVLAWLAHVQAQDKCSTSTALSFSLIGHKGTKCVPGRSVTVKLKAVDACGNVETQKAYVSMVGAP